MCGGGGGSKTDVVGAARETGEQARLLAREQTLANRPNQINPWGSTTWVQTPITGGSTPSTAGPSTAPAFQVAKPEWDKVYDDGESKWTDPEWINYNFGANSDYAQNGTSGSDSTDPFAELPMSSWTQIETLDPALQASLDAQFAQQQGRSELAQSLLPQLQQDMGTPMDWSQFGDVIGFDPEQQRMMAEDAAYQRSANRLDPRFEQEANALEVNLRNKGLRPGDQAYDSAMANFGRTKNDAYEQARLGATAEGRQETSLGMQQNQLANALRTQQMQEALYQRGYTLEQINALMQGQEIEGSTPSTNEKATIADILNGGQGLQGLLG